MEENNSQGNNTITFLAMATGAALGAAAVMLMREENRDTLTKTYEDIKGTGQKILQDTENLSKEVENEVK